MSHRTYVNFSGLKHDTGPRHPEQIARLQTLIDLFDDMELDITTPTSVDFGKLTSAHPAKYVTEIQDAEPENSYAYIDGDTVMSPGSWQAIEDAATIVINAVDAVCLGNVKTVFCAGRPPGHHAEPAQAMGFCFLNNAALGAIHALSFPDIERVAIVDFDVHHGNGTDTIARKTNGLFYASTHQWPLFPGTGHEDDNMKGRIENRRLNAGAKTAEFQDAYIQHIFPALHDFKPDLLMISAGFDAHKDDPVGGCNLNESDFEWITRELKTIASQYCDGRIISVLEGGYNLSALKSSVKAHIEALRSDN